MKREKKLLSILIMLIMLLQMASMPVLAYQDPGYGVQNATSKFANAVPMSVAHRAAWRMAPENSLLAIAASIEMGIDVVEIDVKLTNDGVVVLSHDESIDRCVSVSSGDVSGYSWEQLKETSLEPEKGGTDTNYTISEEQASLLNSLPDYATHCGLAAAGDTLPLSRLDDAIDLIKQYGPNTMINLDHCFSQELFVACYSLFRENGLLGNVFFKNCNSVETMNSWYDAAAEAWNEVHAEDIITAQDVKNSILYVYIIYSENYTPLQQHLDNGDNLVMTEICISDDAEDVRIQEKLEPWCLEKGVAMFVNTMWHGLCSTKDDCEITWAEMLDRGYVAIQTDCASELASYMYDYNRQRDSVETIQAEHFHLFDYETYSFNIIPVAADSDLNKCVEGMVNGDWLSYENIIFDGNENMLDVTFKGLADDAELEFYLDEIAESNKIATVNLYSTADYEDIHTLITGNIEAGEHTLYVQVTGAIGTDLVSLDKFGFLRSADLEGEAEFSQINVETDTGVAPAMPGTVKVTIGGNSYNLKVSWEQISAASYEQEGEFEVQGYVPALRCYTQALVTVRALIPDIVQDEHLALWLDASSGVTADGNAVTQWASKVGDIVAEVKEGSPTIVENAIGNQTGIQFDGDDIMKLTMPDNFWNNKSEFTVLLFNAPESTTNGSNMGTSVSTTYSQDYSILYFYETTSWGSALFTASQNEVLFRFGSGVRYDYGTAYVRETNIGNIFTSTAVRKNGRDNSVFVDGKLVFTGKGQSYSTSFIGSNGEIGYGKKGHNYTGTICQILVYDRALTNDEILAAQKWMAEKYYDEVMAVEQVSVVCEEGTVPVLPETVQVTYASGVTASMGVTWGSVNPNNYLTPGVYDISGELINGSTITATVTVTEKEEIDIDKGEVVTEGLMFWLDAGAGVATDDKGAVTKWESKVGDLAAVPSSGSVTLNPKAVNGQPGLVFDGADSLKMQLETDALNGLTGGTVIAYAASNRDIDMPNRNIAYSGQRGTLLYVPETEGWGSFYLGTYKNAVSVRFGTGNAANPGFAEYRDEVNTDFTTTAVRWDASATTDNYDIEVDGEEFGTAASAGSATSRIDNLLYIGEGKNSQYWNGTTCEILVYNCALNDEELADIYNYLNHKYENLTSNVVWGIYLKEEGQELSSYRGTTLTLNAEVVPFYADNTKLVWESSNQEVATVDENGNVTAVGLGYTTITVTTEEGGFSATCTLSVTKPQAESVWQDIQNMREWADNQDADVYCNWNVMEEALTGTDNVSQDSSLESLLEAYQTLRNAKLALEKKPAMENYGFAEGSENQNIDEGTSLTVDVEPDSRYFVSVNVDGKTLDNEKYVIADGTVITLNEEFIRTLSVGEHKLSIVFVNGAAETCFTILAKHTPTEPDESEPEENITEESEPEESTTEESEDESEPEENITEESEPEESTTEESESEETESWDDKKEKESMASPATGDEAPIMEMVIMLCLGVAGLTVAFLLRKRRNTSGMY